MKTNLENIGVEDLARMARQQNKLFRDGKLRSLGEADPSEGHGNGGPRRASHDDYGRDLSEPGAKAQARRRVL